MIGAGKKYDTLKGIDKIKKAFIDKGLPVFDKVVEFQQLYGGIWYKIGERFYEGYQMDMFYYNNFKGEYQLKHFDFDRIDKKYYFQ